MLPDRKTAITIGSIVFGLSALVALFNLEEDIRGRRDWAECKRKLEAAGEVLDWKTYIPPPVPDASNIFAVPKMVEWFVRSRSDNLTNELVKRMDLAGLSHHISNPELLVLAELTILPVESSNGVPKDADIILRYSSFGKSFFPWSDLPEDSSASPVPTNDPVIPLIAMDDVMLTDGIKHLARAAGLNYSLDPAIGREQLEQPVTFRVEKITAGQTLRILLNQFELQADEDPKTAAWYIRNKNSAAAKIYAAADIREQVKKSFDDALGASAPGSQGLIFLGKPRGRIKPVQMAWCSGTIPKPEELVEFAAEFFPNAPLKFKREGTNSFTIVSDAAYSAEEYLGWSDQFEADFTMIRAALKRPYARMDGDYADPFLISRPNFVAIRSVTQTLAQRAQCHLLLGRSEKALAELTLVHDLFRLSEAAPTGKPVTLVAAMLNAAVTGLFTAAIADGLRLKAWNDPQLAVLQAQLGEIDLIPLTAEALHAERAGACCAVENMPVPGLWQRIKGGNFLALSRRWFYQNLVTIASLDQMVIDACDVTQNTVIPAKAREFKEALTIFDGHVKPSTVLVATLVPDFSGAIGVTARNQTKADQALIVCALERYRLAHGEYPETLEGLVPDFVKIIPHDVIGGKPLKYRRTGRGAFLLYSIGWDEKDDHGAETSNGNWQHESGDWVWPMAY